MATHGRNRLVCVRALSWALVLSVFVGMVTPVDVVEEFDNPQGPAAPDPACPPKTEDDIARRMVATYLHNHTPKNYERAMEVVKEKHCDEAQIEEYFAAYKARKEELHTAQWRLDQDERIDLYGFQTISIGCQTPVEAPFPAVFRAAPKTGYIVRGGYGFDHSPTRVACYVSASTAAEAVAALATTAHYGVDVKKMAERWNDPKGCEATTSRAELQALVQALFRSGAALTSRPHGSIAQLLCRGPDQQHARVANSPMGLKRGWAPLNTRIEPVDPKCLRVGSGSASANLPHYYGRSGGVADPSYQGFGLDRIATPAMVDKYREGGVPGAAVRRDIMVLRGSGRAPEDVFSTGFSPNPRAFAPNTLEADLKKEVRPSLECAERRGEDLLLQSPADAERAMDYHVGPAECSCWFVSTTLSTQVAIKFSTITPMGWVYLMVAREGIELADAGEAEVLLPYGAPGVDVLAARKTLSMRGGFIGPVVINRNYAGSINGAVERQMLKEYFCWDIDGSM